MVPFVVVAASILQFALAATFVVIPVAGSLHGPRAQRAAETEVVRQGFPATLLAERGINFGTSRASVVVAVAIGLCLATLASLNLTGNGAGQLLSWIFQPIVLILGCVIMPGEVFVTRFITSAFAKSDDPTLRNLEVAPFVNAAVTSVPSWYRYVIGLRLVLATAGSLLVIILLMIPTANAHFG